jgi:pyruvate dehydrogenase E2 component (dihydrolipoamide acetyltransferase)
VADQQSARGEVEVVEPSAAQRDFARRVAESKATVPHAYAEIDAEVGEGMALAVVIEACGRALREVPTVNGAYRDGRFELYSRVNVGFAVSTGGTLVFPVIHDADEKDAAGIGDEIDRLSGRARDGGITKPELSGATFSVADPGSDGITRAFAVVNRGQSAFLTVGATRDDGRATLALSFDHRIHQGPEALGFLRTLRELLEAQD